MATPDYLLTNDVTITKDIWDQKVIKAGTFVRPIDFYYVPQHIKDLPDHKWFDRNREVFCYTPIGIQLIPLDKIRKL